MKKLLLSLFAAFSMVAAFADNGDFTVNPASGTSVGKLDAFSITFNDKEQCAPTTTVLEDAVVSDASGYSVSHLKVDATQNSVVLTLTNEIKTAGNYTITIPGRTFIFGYEIDASGEPTGATDSNDLIVLKYTVDPNLNTDIIDTSSPIAFSPVNGSTVQVFSGFDITFNNATTVVFNREAFEDSYTWIYSGGIQVASVYTNNLNTNGALTKHINLSSMGLSTLTEEGYYSIVFPAGAWTIDGVPSEEVTYAFTIAAADPEPEPLEVSVTTTPADETIVDGPVDNVMLTFEGCDEVSVANVYGKTFYIYNNGEIAGQFTTADIRPADTNLTFGIFFNAPEGYVGEWNGLSEAGNYTLNLPAGLFSYIVDEEIKGESEVISLHFSINDPDSIQTIKADAKSLTFGIDGRRANKGIVISNGVKVIR